MPMSNGGVEYWTITTTKTIAMPQPNPPTALLYAVRHGSGDL